MDHRLITTLVCDVGAASPFGNIRFRRGPRCFLFSWKCFPLAGVIASRKPTHASALPSSAPHRLKYCGSALYLMWPAWYSSDMPSCCHHNAHSNSCALLMPPSNFLFQCEFYFHTSEKYIPLKEEKYTQTQSGVVSSFLLHWWNDSAASRGPMGVIGTDCCCCSADTEPFTPPFPGLKVETAWRIGFHSPVVAAQIEQPPSACGSSCLPSCLRSH